MNKSSKDSLKSSETTPVEKTPTEDSKNSSAKVSSKEESVATSVDAKESNVQLEQKTNQKEDTPIKLNSLFAFKKGMTNVYEKNQMVPVTVVQYKEARVTQIKTKEKEGYTAVQVALESSKKSQQIYKKSFNKSRF